MYAIRSYYVIYIDRDVEGDITAGDIKTDADVEILNPDLHIATLNGTNRLYMEIVVSKGRGYVPAEKNKKPGQPIGVIPIDSIFTPVKKVNYTVEDTRVGQVTDFDKLTFEVVITSYSIHYTKLYELPPVPPRTHCAPVHDRPSWSGARVYRAYSRGAGEIARYYRVHRGHAEPGPRTGHLADGQRERCLCGQR